MICCVIVGTLSIEILYKDSLGRVLYVRLVGLFCLSYLIGGLVFIKDGGIIVDLVLSSGVITGHKRLGICSRFIRGL